MLSNSFLWMSVAWGFAFGWLFLFFIEHVGELKRKLMMYVETLNNKFLRGCADLLSGLLIMILGGGVFFLSALLILPAEKNHPSLYYDFYLLGLVGGGLCRLKKFLSWIQRNKRNK